MAKFSPTEAVFAGFRFAKARPATILIWSAYLLVVTAVASAQTSLETAMAVRDQVIAAYQEIMRMPI